MRAILRCKPQGQICVLSLIFILLIFLTAEARAELFGFGAISNDSGQSIELAQQLAVDVSNPGTTWTDPINGETFNQVLFTFYNNPVDTEFFTSNYVESSITDVYFDDGALLGIADIINGGSGVSFQAPATPGDLPGGDSIQPTFETTAGFSADSDTPVQPMGVNPGESVSILFNLKSGKTFEDVLTAIYQGFDDPLMGESLRIGLHLQSIGTQGDSDSFIMTPLPGAAILGLIGLSIIGIKLRRFT